MSKKKNDQPQEVSNEGIPIQNQEYPDERTVCLRMEQGIEWELAADIPPGYEITKIGYKLNEAVYIVRKIVACGTYDDIYREIYG